MRTCTFICFECAVLKRAIDACDWDTVKCFLMRPDPEKAKEEHGEEAMDCKQSPLLYPRQDSVATCYTPVCICQHSAAGLLAFFPAADEVY